MRVIGGFIKSTPIHVMENELCLEPLYLRRRFLASKFWIKCKSLIDNASIISSLDELCNLMRNHYWRTKRKPILAQVHQSLNAIEMHTSPLLEMYTLDTWVANIEVSLCYTIEGLDEPKRRLDPTYLKDKFEVMLKNNYEHCYRIYTDGSKDKNGGGFAFYDSQSQLSSKFKVNAKVCVMYLELLAIAEAISYINSVDFKDFLIITDSCSALQSLARCSSNCRGFTIAYTILDSIRKLQAYGKSVTLQWAPSHVGIVGNEKADQLAKEALSEGVAISCKPFYTDTLPFIKEEIYLLWKTYFDERSLEKGIWY